MPYVTKINECDPTLLAELQKKYSIYLNPRHRHRANSISLYNLHEAGILEPYHRYQPRILTIILRYGCSIMEPVAANLTTLNPADPSLSNCFHRIETGTYVIDTIDLFASLKRAGLSLDDSLLDLTFCAAGIAPLASAVNALAKVNFPITPAFYLKTLRHCKNPLQYAEAMIELLYTKKDFASDITSLILKRINHSSYPREVVHYFRKLQSCNLLDISYLGSNSVPFNPGDGLYNVLYKSYELLWATNWFECHDIPLTANIIRYLHQAQNIRDITYTIIHLYKDPENSKTIQPAFTPDESDTILSILCKSIDPMVTLQAILVLRKENLINDYNICVPIEKARAIAMIDPFSRERLEAIKKMVADEKPVASTLANTLSSNDSRKHTLTPSLHANTQSQVSNKRARPDEKPSVDDAKPIALNNNTISTGNLNSPLIENSLFNTMNVNSPMTNHNSHYQVSATLSDDKTDSNVVKTSTQTFSARQKPGPRTVAHISNDIARLMADSSLKALIKNLPDLMSSRNHAFFNLQNDLSIEAFLTLLKVSNRINGQSLEPYANRLSQLLNERRAEAKSNTIVSSFLR